MQVKHNSKALSIVESFKYKMHAYTKTKKKSLSNFAELSQSLFISSSF